MKKQRCKIARIGTLGEGKGTGYVFLTPAPFNEISDYPEKPSDLSEEDLINLLIDSKDLFAREAIKYFIRRKKKCSASDICIKATELSKPRGSELGKNHSAPRSKKKKDTNY